MLSLYAQQTIVDAMPVGACILNGPHHTIIAVNEQMLAIWHKDQSVVGRNLAEVITEFYDQSAFELLNDTYLTGANYYNLPGKTQPVVNGKSPILYFDYSFKPLQDQEGRIYGIVHTAINVTQIIDAQRKLKQMNKVLSATNAELITLNQQNTALNAKQAVIHDQLLESEQRLRSIFEQAPLALCVLSGPKHIIELSNERMLRLWGQNNIVTGHSYADICKESGFGPAVELLNHVYCSAEAFTDNEVKAPIYRAEGGATGYFNHTYQPIKDAQGDTTGILMMIEDVTERVETRNQGIQIGEQLGLAVEAAKIGTWHIDPVTKALSYNPMLAEVFGYQAAEPMTYEQAIGQVLEEYREAIIREIDCAVATGGAYDFTYQQKRFNDGKVIWLRSVGRMTNNERTMGTLFSGIVMDVTQLKEDEQRKNAFISMVSHELKTPLTSTISYLQVAQKRAQNSDDTVAANMLERAGKQLGKMTRMINGFLNVSRLESGKIQIDRQHFNLALLIKETEEEAVAAITTHQVVFAPVQEVWIEADRDKIGQVINNLLSNAVKYSSPRSTIHVVCQKVGNHVQVSVRDEGIGVPNEELPKLFDRYYRAKETETQHIAGFGIGLYLCCEIIKRHEGSIWAESELGKGSTFHFLLRVAE